jgi:hypothetical protein
MCPGCHNFQGNPQRFCTESHLRKFHEKRGLHVEKIATPSAEPISESEEDSDSEEDEDEEDEDEEESAPAAKQPAKARGTARPTGVRGEVTVLGRGGHCTQPVPQKQVRQRLVWSTTKCGSCKAQFACQVQCPGCHNFLKKPQRFCTQRCLKRFHQQRQLSVETGGHVHVGAGSQSDSGEAPATAADGSEPASASESSDGSGAEAAAGKKRARGDAAASTKETNGGDPTGVLEWLEGWQPREPIAVTEHVLAFYSDPKDSRGHWYDAPSLLLPCVARPCRGESGPQPW